MIEICCASPLRDTPYNTKVCLKCGLERRSCLSIEARGEAHNYISHAPFFNSYSRQKRFICMLDSVLFATGHKLDEPILRYLSETAPSEKFPTSADLVTHIRKSRIKDKRYASLHFLSKLFASDYKYPQHCEHDLRRSRSDIIWMFEDVQFGHRKYFQNSNFFNYCWLLRKFLVRSNLSKFNVFVKPLKCKHRQRTYEMMYATILHSPSLRRAH